MFSFIRWYKAYDHFDMSNPILFSVIPWLLLCYFYIRVGILVVKMIFWHFETSRITWHVFDKLFFCVWSFLVDGIPIRVFKNNEKNGVAYPTSQPMKIYSSLWEADDWATQGGRVKTDWSNAPFRAHYRNFDDKSSCSRTSNLTWVTCDGNKNSWMWTTLNNHQIGQMNWVQKEFLIYNYCTDYKRFPQGFAKECYLWKLWLILLLWQFSSIFLKNFCFICPSCYLILVMLLWFILSFFFKCFCVVIIHAYIMLHKIKSCTW